jgi:CheY-like chemotaxis protein
MTTMQTRIDQPVAALNYPVLLDPAPRRWAAPGEERRGGPAPRSAGADTGERLLGKRVLIVEDEALVAFELQLAFDDEGAEIVGPALSLMKALELVTHDQIDLAVLDVDLGGDSVYPVAELLLQRGVPFVFHTGHGSRTQLSALFPGTTTFLKPSMPETLIAHLARIAR